MPTVGEVENALDAVRRAFRADGADLVVQTVSGGHAVIELVTNEQTCLDCIVPPPMLQQLVSRALKSTVPLETVEVVDHRVAA
jgi:Fe-S cluster biogenesis protein NfuA